MSFTDRCLCLSVMQQYIWNPNCIKSTCSLVLSDLTGILRMMSQDSMSTLLSLPSTVACDPSPLPSHRRMAPPSPAAHPAALLAPCSGLRGCCGRCPPSVIHPLGLKQEYMGPSSRQHHFLWPCMCVVLLFCAIISQVGTVLFSLSIAACIVLNVCEGAHLHQLSACELWVVEQKCRMAYATDICKFLTWMHNSLWWIQVL